jgi:cellulose synthase (UDP-forming)
VVIGVVRVAVGQAHLWGTVFNMVWVLFDLAIFSVIIKAARYRGFEPPPSPDRLATGSGARHEGAA